jgi:hypothetical protein
VLVLLEPPLSEQHGRRPTDCPPVYSKVHLSMAQSLQHDTNRILVFFCLPYDLFCSGVFAGYCFELVQRV